MATTTATPHQIVPLHLSGNTTEQQNRMLKESLGEAVQNAYETRSNNWTGRACRLFLTWTAN